jgi:hypothetical protein
MGEIAPKSRDVTATEVNTVQMASDIRVDERRDSIADVLQNVVGDMHWLMFNFWTENEVTDLIGQEGAVVWIENKQEMMDGGMFEVVVDPDSSVPMSRAGREQKAVQVYGLLKENPVVDPLKLTAKVTHELQGGYDEVLKDPNTLNQVMTNPQPPMPQMPPGGSAMSPQRGHNAA